MVKKIYKTELLAPAKDYETGVTAINAGADAVYIGASCFGARHSACNNLEDIEKLVKYAHKFNVKIHVTINTLLNDEELKQAKKLIEELYRIGVDAIIVQDMGIVNLAIKGELPPIELHASTQCNNRTLEKVKFLENTGFSRVILARELSLKEIKETVNQTKCEIETFIHGALCVCYSGQCNLSYFIGGRSSNKGECAQPCRKKYTLTDEKGNIIAKNKYLLSLKDFRASEYLEDLTEAGVKSFKIEGRLKDKNYVKNVVAYYRKQLDKISEKTSSGIIIHNFEPNVEKSFNRDFTTYFLKKRENSYNFDSPKMKGEYIGKIKKSEEGWFELENNKKLNPQDGICFFEDGELTGCLVNKCQNSKIYINKKIKIKKDVNIYRNIDSEFNKQISNSKICRKIRTKIEVKENTIKITDEDKNCVEYVITEKEPPKNPQKMKETFIKQFSKTGESDFCVEQAEIKSEIPFLPVSKINEIRRTLFAKLTEERLKNYKREKPLKMQYTKYIKQEADYHENIQNKEAEEFYKKCNCKIKERAIETTKDFKDKELMRTKHCLKYAFNMCKSPQKLFLQDEKNKRYRLEFDCKNCEMIIFSE